MEYFPNVFFSAQSFSSTSSLSCVRSFLIVFQFRFLHGRRFDWPHNPPVVCHSSHLKTECLSHSQQMLLHDIMLLKTKSKEIHERQSGPHDYQSSQIVYDLTGKFPRFSQI